LILFASAAPFVLLNVYWNYTHCWANIMFNVFNRNKKEEFSVAKVILYLACQAYLLTPAVVYYAVKDLKVLKERFIEAKARLNDTGFALFAFVFCVPLILFALLSVKKVVGLHWALSFYPFMYLLAFFVFSEEQLVKIIKFTAFFTGIHLFVIGAVLSVPVNISNHTKITAR